MQNSKRFPWETDGEIVVFETPEQTRISHQVAPFGARIAAALIDYTFLVLLGILLWLLLLIAVLPLSLGAGGRVFLHVTTVSIVLEFLVSTFYFVWCEVRGEGRTRGKKRLGIRTIMANGQGLTLAAALVRNLARIVDNLPILWLVPALAKGRRRLGDLLAGTLVVIDDTTITDRPARAVMGRLGQSYQNLVDRKFYFSAEMATKLYADDLNLIEHLEVRSQAASPAQGRRIREEVAKKYAERLGLQAEKAFVTEDPQRFLDELYLFLKDRFEAQAY